MICHGCSILQEVLCLAASAQIAPLSRCENILGFLQRSLPLAGAFFWFPESIAVHGKRFLEARDSGGFPPCPPLPAPAVNPSERRCIVAAGADALHFPAGETGGDLGVLTLTFCGPPPDDPALELCARSVSMVLADLVQRHADACRQQRQLRERDLLSELARTLNGMQSVQALLDELWQVMERSGGVACVILRLLNGAAESGQTRMRTALHRQSDLGTFEKMEQKLRSLILKDEQLHSIAGSVETPAALGVPLMSQDRMVGCLFLAEDGRSGALKLALSEENHSFIESLGGLIAQNLERIQAFQDRAMLLEENTRKLHETSLLYRISRAMHSTLRLDELMHLILSAVTVPWGGGFERAMLFLANERSGVLQGMVGVTQQSARYLFPREEPGAEWGLPLISEETREKQRRDAFCQLVIKQRLSLSADDNPLADALGRDQLLFIADPHAFPGSFGRLAETVELNACALVPLRGRSRALGVLVVDSSRMPQNALVERRRFLELFANQAAQAMENSMLLHRLEASHQDLRETQERLIQGEKMAALGETAASVTHELRNPLVSIGGFARRLQRTLPEESKERGYSEIIVREVRRMEEMLTNILGFSKKQMLCIADCDLIKVLEEVLSLQEDPLREANVRLVREFSDDVNIIQGDNQKLRQVMVNLIDNARQAMREGGVLIVRVYRVTLRGDRAVAVEIEDTGGGIPANILRNIFNPFFTTRKQGTGLGLPIVHRIIEHHQGEIEVQNTERGARFVLRLPETPPTCQLMDKHRPFS